MNSLMEREALFFVEELQRLYLSVRNLEGLLECLDSRFSWIGTGREKISNNFDEARAILELEFQEYGGRFSIIETESKVVILSDTQCMVYGTCNAEPEDRCGNILELRYTLICEKTVEGMRLIHCNISKPDDAQERYQLIMNQTTDVIFEWDIISDTLSYSDNWEKRFGYKPNTCNACKNFLVSQNVHQEDRAILEKCLNDIKAGTSYSEIEVRLKDCNGIYHWCKIRVTVRFSERGVATKAVGIILDIQEEKRYCQLLLEKAQRDVLTGLYNKAAIKEHVEKKMKTPVRNKNQVLMIIDVDYFKQVNDTYGHQYGDTVLTEVADTIKKQFRYTDLLGRIGGDEFVIYLSSVNKKAEVEKKAETILLSLSQIKQGPSKTPITCSIGIAFFPEDETDYNRLFKCADIALYYVKSVGKNNYAFFDPAIHDEETIIMPFISSVKK